MLKFCSWIWVDFGFQLDIFHYTIHMTGFFFFNWGYLLKRQQFIICSKQLVFRVYNQQNKWECVSEKHQINYWRRGESVSFLANCLWAILELNGNTKLILLSRTMWERLYSLFVIVVFSFTHWKKENHVAFQLIFNFWFES